MPLTERGRACRSVESLIGARSPARTCKPFPDRRRSIPETGATDHSAGMKQYPCLRKDRPHRRCRSVARCRPAPLAKAPSAPAARPQERCRRDGGEDSLPPSAASCEATEDAVPGTRRLASGRRLSAQPGRHRVSACVLARRAAYPRRGYCYSETRVPGRAAISGKAFRMARSKVASGQASRRASSTKSVS